MPQLMTMDLQVSGIHRPNAVFYGQDTTGVTGPVAGHGWLPSSGGQNGRRVVG